MNPSCDVARSAAQLSGVILAGGKSSRFGADKSQMEFSGRRVVDRLLEVLRQFPFQSLAIILGRISPLSWPREILLLPDDQEGLGPIGGITTALKHLPGGILVVACDMPLISAPLVAWLLSRYDPRADAVIPRHSQGIEPLFGIYEKGFLPALQEAIRRGQYGLRFLAEEAKVSLVDVPENFSVEREFVNINTPEDYERALRTMS